MDVVCEEMIKGAFTMYRLQAGRGASLRPR